MLERGIVTISITSADINVFLNKLITAGVAIYNVRKSDELSVQLNVRKRSTKLINAIAASCGSDVQEIAHRGMWSQLKRIYRRPILLIGVLLWLVLIFVLPSRILFVRVEGNSTIPSLLIEETAAKYGLSFGSVREKLRNEKLKNALLAEIPKLQWVGVNTSGCLAVISVRERSATETMKDDLFVGHVVASEDGIIRNLTVTKGTPLCMSGQAVRKDQVLVSGYTNCGFVTRAEVADAEVLAITIRQLTTRQCATYIYRREIVDRQTEYSIQIGKNIVKFSNKAGIPDGNCAKLYKCKYLILPGGFRLPIALIYETTLRYEDETLSIDIDEQESRTLAEAYLDDQMIAGRIISSDYQRERMGSYSAIKGMYICEENIGKLRKEEIGK